MAGKAPVRRTVDAGGLRIGVVAARWHGELTEVMATRAETAAAECGVEAVIQERVAGSVELPVLAQGLAAHVDAVVALGVVVRGQTAHFDYVCRSVTDGLTRVALDTATPIGHGVLMVDDLDQARARAGLADSAEDKGADAAVAVLEAAVTLRRLESGSIST